MLVQLLYARLQVLTYLLTRPLGAEGHRESGEGVDQACLSRLIYIQTPLEFTHICTRLTAAGVRVLLGSRMCYPYPYPSLTPAATRAGCRTRDNLYLKVVVIDGGWEGQV